MTSPNTATIGVLMLNTHFPRLQGDIGNPSSFNYPTLYKTIEQAHPANVITGEAITQCLTAEFTTAAFELTDKGASLITTSCGFLAPLQNTLGQRINVPVLTSALTLLPLLATIHGGSQTLGVMTFDRDKLNTHHLGDSAPGAVSGLQPQDSLKQTIAQDLPDLDEKKALAETLRCADELLHQSRDLRGIVLECTNLSPYKQAIRTHTGLPVYDIIDAVHWLMESLKPQHR